MKFRIMHDNYPEEWADYWGDDVPRLVSFGRRHVNYADPDQFFDWSPQGMVPKIGLRRQLATGTAFLLSYYEHGLCAWSLRGEGSSCPWDSVDVAGIVWVPREVPAGHREAVARDYARLYTEWYNGNVYGWEALDDDGEVIDSCYGYLGYDAAVEDARSAWGEDAVEVD